VRSAIFKSQYGGIAEILEANLSLPARLGEKHKRNVAKNKNRSTIVIDKNVYGVDKLLPVASSQSICITPSIGLVEGAV